jgi:hypothetical protein
MFILESKEDLRNLLHYKSCFIQIIPNDNREHPIKSSMSALYIKFPDETSYILSINHPDSVLLKKDDVEEFLLQFNYILTFNHKSTLYYFSKLNKKLYDIELFYYLNNKKLQLDLKLYDVFYSKYNTTDINNLIPITKHFEISELNGKHIDFNIIHNIPSGYMFYKQTLIPTFFLMEKQGIKNTEGEMEYGIYNLYTLTGRPSHTFGGKNYLTLTQQLRQNYTTSNDYLFEIDYSAYHLHIIANLINYDFQGKDVHSYLAKYYFPDQEITEELYKKSKQITFRYIYSDDNRYENIEFFNKLKELTKELYKGYLEKGYIVSPISGKNIYFENNINPAKILNYYIQSYETESNIITIMNIFKKLKNHKTKMILYTFDSFLIDYSDEDGKSILKSIMNIIKQDKYSIKVKYGKNLGNLTTI